MKKTFTRFCAFFLCAALIMQGCTYHGKIRRGIYKHPDYIEKINARVMVVSNKYFPVTVSADPYGQYNFRLSDGLPIAVADALGTLFTEVDVNEYKYRKNYDYIVEIDYEAKLEPGAAKIQLQNVLTPVITFAPVLTTYLTLTVRNPQTGYAVARYFDVTYKFPPLKNNDTALWLANFFKVITLGLLSPLEFQIMGSKIRKMLENGITASLSDKIMPKMEEDRVNFTQEHETEKTNVRVDGKYIPFMQATVYIYTDNAVGSGFFISPDGYIITNRHVVGNNRDVSVVLYDERNLMDKTDPMSWPETDKMANKVRFGKVLKTNKTRDLALIKVEGENFPFLEMETDRRKYTTGAEVVAIGAPKSIEWSASQGVISATRDNNGVDTIQTDAAINNGNSGGPLISLDSGKIIGVNSWARVAQDVEEAKKGIQNLNFAISAFEVQRTLGVTQPVNPDDFVHPAD